MIPRALPALLRHAVITGWDIHVENGIADMTARFTRGPDEVVLVWVCWWGSDDPARLDESSINGTPTPYTQCTRLIRSPEGA